MNAGELLDGLAAFPNTQDAGADGNGILASRLVNGVEYARAEAVDEARLRSSYKTRHGGGATPLVLLADDPVQSGYVRVLGPQRDGPLRRVRAVALLGVAEKTLSVRRLQAVRLLAEELDRLDTERIAGLKVRGLGTEHLFGTRLPDSPRWASLTAVVDGVSRSGWRELLTDLGYTFEALKPQGYLGRADGRPAIVVHPRAQAWLFARLDDEGRLPEGALLADCRAHHAAYGLLAAGTRMRLLAAGAEEAGSATRYLELDAAALEPERRALLGLLAPAYLADGAFKDVLAEARDYGQQLRKRLDRVLRERVLPVLGSELGRWAKAEGRDLADDDVRHDLEAGALLWVFRALFLLYAESAGHLPMGNPTYRERSLTRTAERAWEERDAADPASTALWEDVGALVRRMRTGHTAWDLPAYNGDLFAAGSVAGAATLEAAAIADAALAPALVALARDAEDPEVGVDFSGLEIGHLGYVYEGLLSLRLSLADRDFGYDARADRYVAPAPDAAPDVRAGDLLWLTDEGGRKGGGVYYTRTELVRHLVRGAVGPAFERHLQQVRALAATDPEQASARLFDFYVLDPACGSAHFLVEVVDELADRIAQLLGDLALPGFREQLDALRARAGSFGAGIEDTALLKRLVLKRCVHGVDLSAMGVEIAKVSLWLTTFVPGLSLAYLDHNVQRGNALIGVASAEEVTQESLFGDALRARIDEAAHAAVALARIDDATPKQVDASRAADAALQERVAGVRAVFDLWTAEPLGQTGARDEARMHGAELLDGASSAAALEAEETCAAEHVLHWPLAFAEVFARERPGFDAVVGNPPWEEVTVEELAFYARYRPGIRALGPTLRAAALADLRADRPDLQLELEREQGRTTRHKRYFRDADAYTVTAGDPDLYKLFSQRYQSVVRAGGAIGVVLPRSAFSAKGSAAFRRWLFDEATPRRLDFLLNNRSWAFDIHPQYSVALLVADRDQPAAGVEVAGVAASAEAFVAQVGAPGLVLRREALGGLLEVPLLPTQADADLLAKLRREDEFGLGGGRWRCFPLREFHETDDKVLWEDQTDGWRLWKGESFDQYAPTGRAERHCPPTDLAMRKALKKRPGADAVVASRSSVDQRRAAVARSVERARVSFRDVTNRTNSRTVIAAVVPPATFLTNTAPYLAFLDDDPRTEAACLGVLNSLVFDWQARRFVEIHLNFFILEGLRVPALDGEDFAAVGRAAARLSCPDERFADFAEATGVEVGPLDDDERDALRAEIDARVARAWHLSADELEVVFADFTVAAVPADYRDRVRDRFAELRR
ncbi:MAG: Eco57I restriction-modification methylase domain-containing protein [Solirubrobacteraceae bacterium]